VSDVLHIGFTGTRNGMTDAQRRKVDMVVAEVIGGDVNLRVVAHHGDCIGADEKFHEIAQQYGCKTIGHPSTHNLRAYCKFDKELDRKAPLARNADIVAESRVMIACPAEETEQQRSGTWSTVRLARRAGKQLAIVLPDGTATRERWSDGL
jgi:hypothetical protein